MNERGFVGEEASKKYDTVGTSVKAALVYLGTALVKIKSSKGGGATEVPYFVCHQSPVPTERQAITHTKLLTNGPCWAFADSILHRLAPLWVGARGLEFTWEYILQGIEANANLLSETRAWVASFQSGRL
ncbi:hypothetical protein QJS04_geneDACA016086 [Acorus gramineus]|uniref:BOS complex subunit TMEM147 n=1 Tax=Acorus gramineus TaxID=55184 RepID=A0AAV9BGE3_ACOGR|nr:hypothetical protein QJS04_geneDACA016086 [Acorus gramineus]